MITQEDAVKIAKALISDHFSELKAKRIKYRFVSGKRHDYYMAVKWFPFGSLIYIENEILDFSQPAFKGCLAHELAHLVIDSRKSFLKRLWESFVSSKDETIEERNADILAIERGLGEALQQFHREHEKEYKAYNSSEGLSKKEIKKFLKSRH